MFPEFIISPTPEQTEASDSTVTAVSIYSDESALSNADKWQFIIQMFHQPFTLFTPVDYYAVYMGDMAMSAEAMQYLLDLRIQVIRMLLLNAPGDHELHWQYMHNKIWFVRFRERAELGNHNDVNDPRAHYSGLKQ